MQLRIIGGCLQLVLFFFLIAGILNMIKKYHGLAFIMVILQMAFAFTATV